MSFQRSGKIRFSNNLLFKATAVHNNEYKKNIYKVSTCKSYFNDSYSYVDYNVILDIINTLDRNLVGC